jgi:guanylate kinase
MQSKETQARIVVIAGPTACGKRETIRHILTAMPQYTQLITMTTRPMRVGEVEGVDHYFVDNATFLERKERGEVPEYRHVPHLDTYYGIHAPSLAQQLARDTHLVSDVDIVGYTYLRQHYATLGVFMVPKTMDELRGRLRKRDPGISTSELEERMRIADIEVAEHAPQYDYVVVNVDGALDRAVERTLEIMTQEGYT